MRWMRVAAVLAAMAGLSACATAYGPGSGAVWGGLAESELQPGIWRLTSRGTVQTTQETIQTYWLYRAAELSLEQGRDGFEVLSDIRFVERAPAPDRPVQIAASTPIFIPIYTGPGPALPVLEGDIHLLTKPFEPVPGKTFDAAALKQTLEPYVKGKRCEAGNVCPHAHWYVYGGGKGEK